MIALIDVNVLLDVVQIRHPHYYDSAAVLSAAREGEFLAVIPLHGVTTLFYLVERSSGTAVANQTVDWVLQHFDVPAIDKSVLVRARALGLIDFEDSVVAAVAESSQCHYIVSRNAADFSKSRVPAVSPSDFLAILAGTP